MPQQRESKEMPGVFQWQEIFREAGIAQLNPPNDICTFGKTKSEWECIASHLQRAAGYVGVASPSESGQKTAGALEAFAAEIMDCIRRVQP